MAKIAIQGNPAGTGTITFQPPNTNTNRTISLPDVDGTVALAEQTSGPIGSIMCFTGTTAPAGFDTTPANASSVNHGLLSIEKINSTANMWVVFGCMGLSDITRNNIICGSFSLSGQIDRNRITTLNGTNTFDAGTINISWEF